MHAAIGAAGGGGGDLRIGDSPERSLERILHRAAAGLGLPAEEATTVVLESESDPACQSCLRSAP
jgi:hypothetical protein